jgi:hypothetical protein
VARHIDAYEHLRGAVLRAQARPEGLAAVTYHGVLGGLKVICATAVPASTSLPAAVSAPGAASATDPVLVRLLANMVLFYQQEVSHVV